MGFTEREVNIMQNIFEGRGYKITEMIFDLGNIDRFVIELVPTYRSSKWTLEAMKKLATDAKTSIWYDSNRIINPVVENDSIVIKTMDDRVTEYLITEFNKRDSDERREIILNSIFTIHEKLQLSCWIPELCDPIETDLNCPGTGFSVVSFGPFGGFRYNTVTCPDRCLSQSDVTRANSDETNCSIVTHNGLISFNGFYAFNQPSPLLINTSFSCITVFLSKQQIDESWFGITSNNTWCLDTNKLPKGGIVIIHTTIPDGIDTEISIHIKTATQITIVDGNLICSFKGGGTRLIIIPMDYIVGIDWE